VIMSLRFNMAAEGCGICMAAPFTELVR